MSEKICLNCKQPFIGRGNIYCSTVCQINFQYETYITRWLANLEDGRRGADAVSLHIRRWLMKQKGEACWSCGWNKKHPSSGKSPLEVDHIDGDHLNNRPDNLRILCPNCHSLTLTYKSRNKGHGRFSRRQRYANGQSY